MAILSASVQLKSPIISPWTHLHPVQFDLSSLLPSFISPRLVIPSEGVPLMDDGPLKATPGSPGVPKWCPISKQRIKSPLPFSTHCNEKQGSWREGILELSIKLKVCPLILEYLKLLCCSGSFSA